MVRDSSDMVKLPDSHPGVDARRCKRRFSGWAIADMDVSPVSTATALLIRWKSGDSGALDQLLPLVYDELRRLARYYLQRERGEHTLQSTALVHEAYLRLVDQNVDWQSRAHFFGIAAQMMRRILVDHARSRNAAKRGDGLKVTLDEKMALAEAQSLDVLALDSALAELSKLDAQQGKVVELRFFAGLSIEETAEAMSISVATVKREWAMAKAWLSRTMSA
jgi:RNA polymerase sigma factor (TIGR02999 family)